MLIIHLAVGTSLLLRFSLSSLVGVLFSIFKLVLDVLMVVVRIITELCVLK